MTAPRRRICVTQIPSAKLVTHTSTYVITHCLARRVGEGELVSVRVFFATFFVRTKKVDNKNSNSTNKLEEPVMSQQ